LAHVQDRIGLVSTSRIDHESNALKRGDEPHGVPAQTLDPAESWLYLPIRLLVGCFSPNPPIPPMFFSITSITGIRLVDAGPPACRRRRWVDLALHALVALGCWVLVACSAKTQSEVPCYSGPDGTQGVGLCHGGTRICPQNGDCTSQCSGQVLPTVEVCDGKDNNCDGKVDEDLLNACGGCSPLAGKPGDACGECGALYCTGLDTLACASAAATIGHQCVADNGCPGTFACSNSVTNCVPSLQPDACGFCSSTPRQGALGASCSDAPGCLGMFVCDPNGGGLVCLGGSINECAVCGPRVANLGATCAAPNGCTGSRVCSADGLRAECQPTITTNECGLCGGPQVDGIGLPCTAAGGKTGRTVCNKARDGLDCAFAVVTLSYDDTNGDNVLAGQMMADRGLRGIFYINSPRFTLSRYMSLDNISTLVEMGNEIGGHTLHHLKLPTLTADEQRMEMCNDRAALLDHGFAVRSLAYPFGFADDVTLGIAHECNFDSARRIGSIATGLAESFTPQDIFQINAPSSVIGTSVLGDLQRRVYGAENAGGWVFINMHHICDGCAANGLHPDVLASFLDWLVPREAEGTLVRTPRDLLPGSPQPAVTFPDTVGGILTNGSFELDSDADGIPDCWQRGGNTRASPWTNGIPHTGSHAASVTVSATGDRLTIQTLQNEACATLQQVGHEYELAAWYISPTAQVTLVLFYRDAENHWYEWKESDAFPVTTEYKQAVWRVDAPTAEGLGIGIRIASPGTLTVDDFAIRDLSLERGDE